MIKPEENKDYFVQDLGHCFELSSNLFHGILGAIEDYTKKGYEFNYDSVRTIGACYVISTIGKEGSTKQDVFVDNQIKILEIEKDELSDALSIIEKEVDELRTNNRTQKSHITRLKNKIKKLEKSED